MLNLRRKYGENAKKIISATAENQFIKTHEIADKIKLSQSTIEKIVAKLKKAGILKRIGPDKGGYWEIVLSYLFCQDLFKIYTCMSHRKEEYSTHLKRKIGGRGAGNLLAYKKLLIV